MRSSSNSSFTAISASGPGNQADIRDNTFTLPIELNSNNTAYHLCNQAQVNADTGPFLRKFDRQGRQDEPGILTRRLNPQRTERPGLDISPLCDVIVHLCQQFKTMLKKPPTGVCQYQTVGRAIDEAETQRLPQLLHPFADDRWRCAQFGSGFSEAAALRDADKSVQLVQVPQRGSKGHYCDPLELINEFSFRWQATRKRLI
jgi:hypothetical protein